MTEAVTNELMYEILKQIQADLGVVKATVADHTHLLMRLREDVHNLRGDDLRMESMQAQTHMRLERIENRLGLTEI